jgi:hypothetical protein
MAGNAKQSQGFVHRQWVALCGPGWSKGEVWFSMAACTALGMWYAMNAWVSGYNWTLLQYIVAGLLAWDLVGGAIGYNSTYMKRHRYGDESLLAPIHHNLQHIHPLIVALFHTAWLPWVSAYWLVTFFLYGEFLEPREDGKRKLGAKGELGVVVFELLVAVTLAVTAFTVPGARPAMGFYAVVVYFNLLPLTFIVHHSPVNMQRPVAVLCVIVMCFLSGTFLSIPLGFAWLIPVYYIKLIMGYTAKEPE